MKLKIVLFDMYEYVSTNSSVVMYVDDMYSRGPWFEPSNVVLKISKLLVFF